MEYGSNILPTDATYYTLVDASISDKALTIYAGGCASYTFQESDISKITEYLRVMLVPDKFTDNYIPRTTVTLHVIYEDGEAYNYAVFPVYCSGKIFTQELKLKAGTYSEFTFEISSKDKVTFKVYEVCPESADNDIRTVIDGVEQSLPRLLYDYNKWPLTVGQQEATIGLISYLLLDNTDLQGHIQLTYQASSNCILTIRIKDTDVTELYAPLIYDIKEGLGSIGIPHAYLNRLKGNHNAVVTAHVSAGVLSIDTRGLMYTIDGGYLAGRVIDTLSTVQDLSLKQVDTTGPSEIWLVGIDAGEILVKSRSYVPEKLKTAFEARYSLGRGKAAAIEFNGYWTQPDDADRFTIITEEDPYLFWIDTANTLWVQYGSDTSTMLQLDEGVSQVKACRGFKSEKYLLQDQGLVVAYLKNGRAYYRQYIYDDTISIYRWTDATEVDSSASEVQHVSIGRLNDYRMQISLTTTEEVRSYITDRTYVNQAAMPERAYIQGLSIQTTPMAYLPTDYEVSLNCIDTYLENDNKRLIAVLDGILELKWYYDIKQYITFNSSIPEYWDPSDEEHIYNLVEMVKSISMVTNPFQGTTTITVELNKAPLNVYTEMYINADYDYAIQLKLDDWGYAPCPITTVAWDTTNKISVDTLDLAEVPVVHNSGIEYRGVSDETIQQIDENNTIEYSLTSNLIYSALTDVECAAPFDTSMVPTVYASGVDYSATSDEPI